MLGMVGGSDGGATPTPTLAAVPTTPALSGAAGLAGTVGWNRTSPGVTAGMRRATGVGLLSVPPTWAANAAAGGATANLPGVTVAAAAERGPGSMPAGLPIGAPGARPTPAVAAPNYGFRPTVTMHPVAAG